MTSDDSDTLRAGIAGHKTMTTSWYDSRFEADHDDTDEQKIVTDFKEGKKSLTGMEFLTVTYQKEGSPKTLNESKNIKITFNEPAANPDGGEGDAAYAPIATAMGAISLALGALAF